MRKGNPRVGQSVDICHRYTVTGRDQVWREGLKSLGEVSGVSTDYSYS